MSRGGVPQPERLVQDLAEEQLGALVARVVEEFLGLVLLDDLALVHEDHAVGDLAGKTHFVGDADHRHAALGEADHDLEHFLDHLGVERGGGLVEQHDLRLHAERAGDGDALLLAAGKLARELLGLLRNLDALEVAHRGFLGLRLGDAAHPDRGERQVLHDRQVREEVEVLEHHADLAAHLVDLLEVGGQRRRR